MKHTIIKNIIGLSALLGLGACQKQLELYPYSTIELTQSFKTVKDATAWNNGLYSDLRGRVYGTYTIPQEVQADYLNAGLDFGNRNGNPHRWGQSFNADDGVLSGTWSGYYSAIKNVNLTIQNFPSIPATTTADAASMAKYTGDAYLARAYYYSELIIRFAKPYEPATAATDLGVPLVLTYDINAMPARSTVKQVYDQIISDINQAKTLLASTAGSQGATKFTKDVALALEARVRLYMQDWAGAMTASNALITSGTYPLINTQAEMTSMWTNDLAKEVIFHSFLSKPNELGNVNNIYLGFISGNSTWDPDFIPTSSFVNLYASTDIRKAAYFSAKSPVVIQGTSYGATITLVNKFPGNPNLWTTAATNYQNTPKIFRVAEAYLIYAEAAAKLGGANEALAINVLNLLRTARGVPPVSGLTGAALMQAVRDERTRELAFEGFRLWDLKRRHLGFTRGTPQNLNAIQQGANYNTLTIAADDNKFTWGIPTNDVTVNKNIVQNPGW